jgi:hypothetical protein
MEPALLAVCQCPRCGDGSTLEAAKDGARCAACGTDFPDVGKVPSLFVEPRRKTADWQRQVTRVVELNERSVELMDEQLKRFDLLPATRGRIETLRAANLQNAERVVGLFRDAGLEPDTRAKASDSAFNVIEYYEHILRDWAWDRDGSGENGRAFAFVKEAIGEDRRLGRTLVLGAGPCRLAYDVQLEYQPELTVALDISPLLLLAARRILFGTDFRLFEFPAEPRNLASVCADHALAAPRGAPERLHLLLADAFSPALRPGSFDTVFTPWFIDIVPVDIRVTLALLHRLLAPGGRWINYGPLAYPNEHAHGQRYSPEELFELVALAGFERGKPRIEQIEFMRSRVAAHAKISQVICFQARKLDPLPRPPEAKPPAWLMLAHLPIPRFAGLDGFKPEHPLLGYIARLIDGRATLADLAARMIKDHGARPDAALDGTRALVNLVHEACQGGG